MKLVCHVTIPGTPYVQGSVIHDSATVEKIKANSDLAKHFSQVANSAFPDPPAPAPAPKLPPEKN